MAVGTRSYQRLGKNRSIFHIRFACHPSSLPTIPHASPFSVTVRPSSVSTFLTKSRRFLAPRATPVSYFRVPPYYILRLPCHISTNYPSTLTVLLISTSLSPLQTQCLQDLRYSSYKLRLPTAPDPYRTRYLRPIGAMKASAPCLRVVPLLPNPP